MKNFIYIATIFSFFIAKAQQDPQYTQYMYNMNIVNPAYAGSQDGMTMSFLARTQWVGTEGAPRTLTFNAQTSLKNNLGIGLSIITDKIGPLSEQNLYADISYTLTLNERTKLAFGLKAGATFLSAPLVFLNTINTGDIAFQNNLNEIKPNFGAGLYLYTDKYYLGLSIPNILRSVHFERTNGVITNALEEMHYFFTGGYVFEFENDIKFKPSFLAKTAISAPISIEYSANVMFNNNFEIGLSYRFEDSFSALVGINVSKKLRMGYAYDHTLSNLGNFNSGSHEVLMIFNFLNKEKRQNPKFF